MVLRANRVQPHIEYVEPGEGAALVNSFIADMPLDDAWADLVLGLNGPQFAITHIDPKETLLIVTYRGDPEPFVDCGQFVTQSALLSDGEKLTVPAASQRASYEIASNLGPAIVARGLELSARVVIHTQAETTERTRLDLDSTYVLTRRSTMSRPNGDPLSTSLRVISFGGGESAAFGNSTRCRGNGKMAPALLRGLVAHAAQRN